MKIFRWLVIILFLAIFAGVIFSGYFLNELYFKRPASGAEAAAFTVAKGESVKKIAGELQRAGIIPSAFIFESYVRLIQAEDIFQAGDYKLLPGSSINALVEALTSINIKESRFTLIEGWSLKDVADYLITKKTVSQENDFYFLTGRPATDYRKTKVDFVRNWTYDFLIDRPAYATLEGYVYPDTYRVLDEAGAEGLVKKALDNFGKKLTPELRAEISRQGKTIFQVITMASILENEVRGYEDRRMVADIFWRRIKIGMPLQADSTINYVTQSGRDRSTYDDLKIDSPWNTYKYAGLPLGPICSPSIEAIRAAVYPSPNSYLYFLTDKNGVVHYAKTTAEHAKNRAKYLD